MQFLDIGTGIPSADNTHEVAQSVVPESRVVYVDNDPMVLVHARALLTSDPAGATAYLDADLRDPEKILADPQLHTTLDLSQPVGLVLIAVTHFLTDDDRPHEHVARLLDALPSGSWLALTHFTTDHIPNQIVERMYAEFASGRMKQDAVPRDRAEFASGRMKQDAVPRDRAEFARFFTGLELAEPGIVPVTEWRPQVPPEQRPALADASIYGAVARKP
ncbi:SAM-dependent methyltransferase [Micromonospora zamorensis]|uniref:SAM-dependent methyltransferase n=1 Tax=Micromonospora zamorensis TaxID=709883 RepID=UPI00340C3AAB